MTVIALLCAILSLAYTPLLSSSTRVTRDEYSKFQRELDCVTLEEYKKHSPQCTPKKCGRFVKDNVFHPEDIKRLHDIARKGLKQHRIDIGGPTILDINTGYVRDSSGLDNLYARHEHDVFDPADFAHYNRIIERLKKEIETTFKVSDLYFTSPTFITRLDGRKEWNPDGVHDEYWHVHADLNNTAHYHYSGLLYMSDWGKDFEGGLLHFVNPDNHHEVTDTVEPVAGRVALFSSGPENTHFVERVTRGQRFVLAFWFTCNPEREMKLFLDGKAHLAFSKDVGEQVRKLMRSQRIVELGGESAADEF